MTDLDTSSGSENAWRRFWNRGGFWRAILLIAVYYGVFSGITNLFVWMGAGVMSSEAGFADPATIFFGLLGPILTMGLLVLAFVGSVGWIGSIFGRQPIGGSWWMWIAVGGILLLNVANYARIDYGSWEMGTLLTVLSLGLVVGFAEELMTRGVIVDVMRRRGYREWTVMFTSALTFALLHSSYFFTEGLQAGSIEFLYTFFFGVLMYLTLRVTGHIIWPILLHASTDPSVFLNTGGIGSAGEAPQAVTLLDYIGGFSQLIVIALGLVLIFFVRGRVAPKETVIS